MKSVCVFSVVALLTILQFPAVQAEDLKVQLRSQVETAPKSGRYHTVVQPETWLPGETAIIVCDVWDAHHCLNAVRRVEEFGPRLNKVLSKARQQGVTIIHAPSDCMAAYTDHPGRLRAINTPKADNLPTDIGSWCSVIPAEEGAVYPIDQSDGGEDDDPTEHAEWAAKLKSMGRDPGRPWEKQADLITIDAARDYVSDRGDEVWSILEARGIKNVILTGVHTNMCVLGRPFGLRQLVKNGRHAVLMRDMTDTMYNPASWPYVSHFSGTDLIISHIERFVCPTITSDQFLGGKTFRFAGDRRPHVAIVMAEGEYDTNQTLPEFAARNLDRDFRVSYVHANESDRNDIPGLAVLDDADVLLVSIRRRVLKPEQMAYFQKWISAGKPVIGIRTASHAFSLRNEPAPEGYVDWPTWDAQVFGGNYHNHHDNQLKATIRATEGNATESPLMTGLAHTSFVAGGSLYKTSPLAKGTQVFLTGEIEGQPIEPVAWSFKRADSGKSFYTSLGHKQDFENASFVRLLVNAVYWAAGVPVPEKLPVASSRTEFERHWVLMPVPGDWESGSQGVLKDYAGVAWYRCVARIPSEWADRPLKLHLPSSQTSAQAWLNGQPFDGAKSADGSRTITSQAVVAGDVNLLVVRIDGRAGVTGLRSAPVLSAGNDEIALAGRWQFRIGDDSAWSNLPLPAKFGTSTDIVFAR